MFRWLIATSLQLRPLVLLIAAAIVIVGVTQLRNASVDVLPEFSQPHVEIQTEALGLSAEEVEQLITVPMEQDLLNGMPWLKSIRSESMPSLSSVVLFFEPSADLMQARQMVAERMTMAVALPHVSRPPMMLQPKSDTSRVMIVGLSSKQASPPAKPISQIQMSVLAHWTIAPRLMGVPGVANVAIWGERSRQLQVLVDPKKLQEKKVPLLNVLETAGNSLWMSTLSFVEASTPGTGGFIDTANQRLGIRHILPIVSPEQLAQVPIEDTKLRLSDVANVVEDHQPLIGDALTNDGAGLLLVIEKFPGANTLEVSRGVEEALAELAPGLAGIDVDPNLFRPADFIESSIHNLAVLLFVGLILVALVLAAFYFDWRPMLVSLLAIPLSLIAAGLVLHLRGATFNMMVVTGFAIALGVVVYDAIIDVENVLRRLRRHREAAGATSAARIILDASLESRTAIVYATLILLLAITPVFFIEGLTGTFLRPLAVTYGLAIIVSMIVALTVTPALCFIFLGKSKMEYRQSPIAARLQGIYASLLSGFLKMDVLAYLLVLVITAAGIATLPHLGRSLLPAFKERDLQIHIKARPGTSQPEMSRITDLVRHELQSIKGIHEVGAHIGRAILGDKIVDVNSSELWVSMNHDVDYDQTAAAIQKVVDGYPGLYITVQGYLKEKSSDVVAEAPQDIVVRLYGDVDQQLRESAQEVQKAITGISGVEKTRIALPLEQATVETEVDLDAAKNYGLKPGDVRRAAATLLSGIQVGSLFEEQKVFDVVVWSTPESRHSLNSVRDLMIDTPSGKQARLGDVAKVRIVPAASVIRHDAVRRYLDVIADVPHRDLALVAADIKTRLKDLTFPLECHAELLGDYAVNSAARSRLIIYSVAAAVGIFLLFQAALGSWRLAILVMLTLPTALAGGLLAAWLSSGVVSFGAAAGLIAVFGVTVCNVIMLISHYKRLERHEGEVIGPSLVLRGSRERLAPILMTSLSAVLAVVPALFMGDRPGLEVIRPLAITMLGGMLTADLLLLFILPALFARLEVSSLHDFDLSPAASGTSHELHGAPRELPV
jgi:CzcA family heavy metal efflux pump